MNKLYWNRCIVFFDTFCFSSSGWLEPLLDRIARNSTTVVCPVIDVIDDTTMEYHWRDSGGVNVGGFDWNLQFNWHAVPERERKRHKVFYYLVFFLPSSVCVYVAFSPIFAVMQFTIFAFFVCVFFFIMFPASLNVRLFFFALLFFLCWTAFDFVSTKCIYI